MRLKVVAQGVFELNPPKKGISQRLRSLTKPTLLSVYYGIHSKYHDRPISSYCFAKIRLAFALRIISVCKKICIRNNE